MNVQRAKEIAASPVMAHVTYNGVPIYIEQVDEENGTATIHPLDQPENKQNVSVSSLKEHWNNFPAALQELNLWSRK